MKPFHELRKDLRERLLRAGVARRHVNRYLAELTDHLEDLKAEEERAGLKGMDAEASALIRLGTTDELASAMAQQRQLQSWCARAPWAVFGLVPVMALAGSWIIALFILWSGWNIFLPKASTPFVRIHGLAILYFGVGKIIYFTAPVVVGWAIVLIAARQRFQVVWPACGLGLIAFLGGTGQVHASGATATHALRRVSMTLTLAPSIQDIPYALFHALAIFTLTVAPYLIWRGVASAMQLRE